MPVTTRRTGRVQHSFGSLNRLRRPIRPIVNATPMASTQQIPTEPTTPKVSSVPTVVELDSNSNRMDSTIAPRDPKISKFSGLNDSLQIRPFVNIFERYFQSLDNNEKILKLGEYLSGDALNFFGTDIINEESISWSEAKERLIRRYGHSDIPPMLSAIRRKLQRHENVKQYFDDKCRFLRQEKGLTEATQTQLLTDGLPDIYRHHFYGKRFATTTEWLQTAQDIEADLNRQKPMSQNSSSAHFSRSDPSSNRPNKLFSKTNNKPKDKKPPYPCRICRDQGITSFHWHSDCPNKPIENSSQELKPSPNEAHLTIARALVTPRTSGDRPILVKTYIKGIKVMAFVDTGANVNLMPESVIHEFKLTLDRRQARPVKTANGFAQTLGTVIFNVTIEKNTQTIEALVITGFEYTLLLSRNTCHQFKLLIDTDAMSVKPKQLPLNCNFMSTQELKPKPNISVSTHLNSTLNRELTSTLDCHTKALTDQFQHLFASDSTDLSRINVEFHRILLSDCQPIAQRPYRQSHSDAEETARQVRELLAKGLIQESVSPYAAPITLADKKDGSKRLCVDYRRLNKITVADKTPLPLIADVIDRLQGSTIFSKLDFASGYWQVPVHQKDVHKTAFVTRDGHFEWFVLPFGLKNSPSTFHRVVRKILGDLVNRGVMSYLDDIVIYAKTRSDHDTLLHEVFQRLSNHNARLKLSKCEFAQNSIEFLGHLIDGKAVRPPLLKIKAITDYPMPTDRKSVERFHGLVNYLREYIPNFATIAEPLTRLLRKDKEFLWTDAQTQAFNRFKELLTQSPVRYIYDPNLTCELHTDASTVGIAAILIQSGHPIGYFSRKLSDAETRYTVTEQECLALVEGIKYFRIYIESTHFKVFTDHIALKWLLNFESTKKRLYRWSQELSTYDFEVIHRPGKHMVHVDALSRAPVCLSIKDEDILSIQRQDLSANNTYHSPVRVITNKTETPVETQQRPQFICTSDALLTIERNGRQLKQVPPSLVREVLVETHDNAGHPGIRKTYKQLQSHYYWPQMRSDIKTFVRSCHSCQLIKPSNHSTFGQLQPLHTPDKPLDLLSTDTVVIGSSASKTSAKYLQVTLDHHSRFVWAKATKTNTSDAIISSLDSVFKSTNGANEKVNDSIIKGIRLELVSNPRLKWSTLVQRVVDNYNQTIHSTTGFTPAFLLFGTDRIGTFHQSLTDARLQAKRNSDSFKAKKKVEFDAKHKPYNPSIGDFVKRRIPSNHPELKKLSPRFEAPFEVISIEGPVNFIIQKLVSQIDGSLTPTAEPIRSHVSQLEPYFHRTRTSGPGECGDNHSLL